jgi:predicted Zn-dependent protease
MRRDIGIVVATALALVGAIAAVPRPSASASPREEHAAPALTTEEETALGWLATAPLAARLGGTLRDDDTLVRRVRTLGARLAATPTAKASPWRFAFDVVDDSAALALALPGGQVIVSRRLLVIVGTDDEGLAALIAHQMAHVLARHAAPAMAADPQARPLLVTLDAPALDVGGAARAALAIVEKARLDDDAEPEADALAARLLVEAGMDAAAGIRVMHAMPEPAPFHGAPGDVDWRAQRLASLARELRRGPT